MKEIENGKMEQAAVDRGLMDGPDILIKQGKS